MASKTPFSATFLLISLLFFTLVTASHSCGTCGNPKPGNGSGSGSGSRSGSGGGTGTGTGTGGAGGGGGAGAGGGGGGGAGAGGGGGGGGGGGSGGGGGGGGGSGGGGSGGGTGTGGGNGGGPGSAVRCPRDALKLGVCANVLGLIRVSIGAPPTLPCCSLLQGLATLEAAACLCTAIRANILGINLNVPISLSLILNNCGRNPPNGFVCP